jgi:hypothetical protein
MFAVRDGGECLTSASLSEVYKQQGQSDECDGGEGGHDAMNVYELKGMYNDEKCILSSETSSPSYLPYN